MRMTPWRGAIGAAVLVVSLVACTGDDDDTSTDGTAATPTSVPPPSTKSEGAATAAATAPATPVAPSTAASAPPTTHAPPPMAVRAVVEPATDTAPTNSAGQLLPAAGGRGFLLVGSRQERPGERWTATLWESGDAAFWADPPPNAALAEGISSTAAGGVWLGQELVIVGEVTTDASRAQAAVWSAPDGWTFGPSVDPYGFPGSVNAAASGPAGLVVGGYGVDPDLGGSYPVVALRTAAAWTATRLPLVDGVAGSVQSVAANGSTVVATGSVDVGTVNQAAVWVSSDGGQTFVAGDASAARAGLGSRLGAVVATASGFAALACTADGPTPTTALMTSVDGLGWRRIEIVATGSSGERFPNVIADCSSLIADGGGLLAGGMDRGSGHVLALGLDGRGDDLLAPRGSGSLAEDGPLAVRRPDGAIGAVDRETRGFAAGLAKDDDDPDGAGLPGSRKRTTTIGVVSLLDRLLTRAVRFPVVYETFSSYGWESDAVWASSSDGAGWQAASRDDVPRDATFVRSGSGVDVAFGWADDPADGIVAGPGQGTTGWIRVAGAAWEPLGLLASGPGGEAIDDAIALPGGGFVAVGSATVADADGRTTETPITMGSVDGRAWTAEPHPAASDQTSVSQLCPLPGGGVLAVGSTIVDGTSLLYLLRRDPAGGWSEMDRNAFPPDVEWFADCDVVGGVAVLVTVTPDTAPVVYTSADGATFTPVVVDVPGASNAAINALALVGDRLYGAGAATMGIGSADAALWRSSDGATWEPVPVAGLDGPGDQVSTDVAAGPTGDVVLAGFDRGQVVTWTVTPP